MNALIQRMLLSSLFTVDFGGVLKEKDRNKIHQLSLKVLDLTIQNVTQGRFACFDAQVADFGCERRAWGVYKIVSDQNLKEECALLAKQEEKNPDKILISQDLAYLVQCYLLRYIRVTETNKDNEEVFRCKPNKIKNLVEGLNWEICDKIMFLFQTRVSGESVDHVRYVADSLTTLDTTKKHKISIMLSLPNMKQVQEVKGKVTRCYVDSYYQFMPVFIRLRELQVPVLVKKMVKMGERPCGTLFRSDGSQGSFQAISASSLDPKSALIVIEGEFGEGLELGDVRGKMLQHGLEQVMLSGIAQKSIDFKGDPEVRAAIEKAKTLECDEESKPFFTVDHAFCSSLGEESEDGDIV